MDGKVMEVQPDVDVKAVFYIELKAQPSLQP